MADETGPHRPLIVGVLCLGAFLVGVGMLPGGGGSEGGSRALVFRGRVSGRVYAEALPGREPERPLVGTLVTVLPHSAQFLDRLRDLRDGARASARHYAAASRLLRAEQARYEARLRASGGAAGVIQTVVAGADGRFFLENLPPGPLILVARHAVFIERTGPRQSRREREIFGTRPRLAGHYTVEMWVRDLLVSADHGVVVELTDRNVWFTGTEEERREDPSR